MSTTKRTLCILQLCIGFSALLWLILYPHLGAVYHYKSHMLPYEVILSEEALLQTLPDSERVSILEKYEASKALLSQTSAWHFFANVPLFEYSWILLSILIPLSLLLKVEGIKKALWLLPALTFLMFSENAKLEDIFIEKIPSEGYLVRNYLKEPLSQSVSKQFEQLKKGWSDYLITEYCLEKPSEDIKSYERQIARGQFLFNVEKIKNRPLVTLKKEKSSQFLLFFLLLWNIFFALSFQRFLKKEINQKACQESY